MIVQMFHNKDHDILVYIDNNHLKFQFLHMFHHLNMDLMNNIHHIFDDYSMFYYIHSHNNHLYILHDKYKFPIKKNKINNRIFQCLLNRFTFVVAVFVTKQVPPFSHGFVKQKTNCA